MEVYRKKITSCTAFSLRIFCCSSLTRSSCSLKQKLLFCLSLLLKGKKKNRHISTVADADYMCQMKNNIFAILALTCQTWVSWQKNEWLRENDGLPITLHNDIFGEKENHVIIVQQMPKTWKVKVLSFTKTTKHTVNRAQCLCIKQTST